MADDDAGGVGAGGEPEFDVQSHGAVSVVSVLMAVRNMDLCRELVSESGCSAFFVRLPIEGLTFCLVSVLERYLGQCVALGASLIDGDSKLTDELSRFLNNVSCTRNDSRLQVGRCGDSNIRCCQARHRFFESAEGLGMDAGRDLGAEATGQIGFVHDQQATGFVHALL
jgi:hypothetical protein